MKFFKNIFRILHIIFVLLKYYFRRETLGKRLRLAFEELGPVTIKFGQTLSVRPDIVGEKISQELSYLRDKLTPFNFAIVKKTIKTDFGKNINELFVEFVETPVAAASIAQVHKAKLKNGEQVAVKVLRPNIDKIFARDIDLFYFLASLIERFSPKYRRLKLPEVVATLEESVRIELDLRFEAASASELAQNFEDDQTIYIPNVFWNLTSKHVLTMEWVEGISIDDKKALKDKGLDLKKLASNLAVSFFNQAYRDGFFHADVHPGNLFVNDKGQIVVVDFGIMGRIDKKTRIYVAKILHGFLKRDYRRVAEIHFEAGYVPKHQSIDAFASACRSIGEPIVGLPFNEISLARLLAQLFEITGTFEMETQPQLLLLQKTMMLVEGVGANLDNKVNLWKLAEPWIEDWAIANIGIEAKIRDKFIDTYHYLSELPGKINQALSEQPSIKDETPQGFLYGIIFTLSLILITKLFL